MFNIIVEGNLRYHLQTIKKRIQTEGSVDYTLPDRITFNETVGNDLEAVGITIAQPGMMLHLRPSCSKDKASITIGLYCDLRSGGLGKDPCHYMYNLPILQYENRDTQLSNEWKKTWTIPCVISSFTYTVDGDDLHFVSRVPSWARGTDNLHLPN